MHTPDIHCPVTHEPTADRAALGPLLAYLRSGARPDVDVTFPKGSLRADGRLDLCKQDTGVTGCRDVLAALTESYAVSSLLLGTNGIGDEGAALLADATRSVRLKTLYLGCNLIGPEGTARLADVLADDTHVRALWLKRNPIRPEGARALAGMLRRNRHLRTLDLVNTGIGPDGAAAVIDALLEADHPLERLYLGGNGLDETTAPLLADLVRHGRLRGLYLNVNHLGDGGAGVLADALRDARDLDAIGLASNGLTDAGVARVLSAVAEGGTVTDVDLGFSPSTRVLGASGNTLGQAGVLAAHHLLRAHLTLRSLELPTRHAGVSTAGVEAEASRHPRLTRFTHGRHVTPAVRTRLEENVMRHGPAAPHEDARMIRSVYR